MRKLCYGTSDASRQMQAWQARASGAIWTPKSHRGVARPSLSDVQYGGRADHSHPAGYVLVPPPGIAPSRCDSLGASV
jgi:hypothetical protein